MRALELALLVISGLLLILSARPLLKAHWIAIAGGVLLSLLLQASVEGARWQLVPADVLAGGIVVHALLRVGGWRTRKNKAVRILVVCLGLGLLTLTGILASALPVFTLPTPTGNYAIGTTYLTVIDESRDDPFLANSTQKRRLLLKILYPARKDNAKPYLSYFHGSKRLMQGLANFYQLPSFLFDHFQLVKTHSQEEPEVAPGEANFPVVLFSHGAGMTMETETALLEELASQGYVVVAIDHPYVSVATDFPDRLVSAREATRNFEAPEPAEPITQIMADDSSYVLDVLKRLQLGQIKSPLQGRVNLQEIGAIGHSVGGAVGYHLALREPRIKAAINLDGAVYVLPKNAAHKAPFLMLANDKFFVQALQNRRNLMKVYGSSSEDQAEMKMLFGSKRAYEAQYARAQKWQEGLIHTLKTSGTLYTIEGSDHMKFTDLGLFFGNRSLREVLQIGGKTQPSRCLEITGALTVAFFNQHLKARGAERLNSLPTTYRELKNIPLK